MATTFFRPNFSPGFWASGEPWTNLHYIAMVGNSFNGLNLADHRIGSNTAFGSSVWWEPLGRFGPGPSDAEGHERPVLRFGMSQTVSRDHLASASVGSVEPRRHFVSPCRTARLWLQRVPWGLGSASIRPTSSSGRSMLRSNFGGSAFQVNTTCAGSMISEPLVVGPDSESVRPRWLSADILLYHSESVGDLCRYSGVVTRSVWGKRGRIGEEGQLVCHWQPQLADDLRRDPTESFPLRKTCSRDIVPGRVEPCSNFRCSPTFELNNLDSNS